MANSIDTWDIDNDAENPQWTESSSWESGSPPANDGTAFVYFPGLDLYHDCFCEGFHTVALDIDIDVDTLKFGGQSFYSFHSSVSGSLITLQSGLTTENGELNSEVYFDSSISWQLGGDLLFNLGYYTEVEIAGQVFQGSSDSLTIDNGGILLLSGDNASSLGGSIKVIEGALGLAHDDAAGTALIELGQSSDPGGATTALIAVDGQRSIDNNVVVWGLLHTEEDDQDANELTLAGDVFLAGDTRIENYGGILSFDGNIIETSGSEVAASVGGVHVTIDADEPVIFGGTTGFTGGLEVENGVAIFADINALPTGPMGAAFTATDEDAYIGLLIDSETDRLAATAAFLALFDPTGFNGTIGFDTDPGNPGQINNYSGPIDLTGMNASRIGSVTTAELSGTITPDGTDYQFGNGGGTLLIGSLLEDDDGGESPRGLQVVSNDDDPLTVFINNSANSFTGQASAEHSALIFGDAPGALPADVTLQLFDGGYIGLQDATRSISDYLGQFNPSLTTGIVGFDSQDRNTNRVINEAIDLSGFTSAEPDFFIGTATWVNLGGEITLPEHATEYRFAGYKGGFLNVTGNLTDADGGSGASLGVHIGDEMVQGTFGHEPPGGDDVDSGVRLEGVNTYTGGTRLAAGHLVITNNASLGTGALTVPGGGYGYTDFLNYGYGVYSYYGYDYDDDFVPILYSDTADLVLPNAVEVDGLLEVDVPFHAVDHNLELAGDISGPGGIDKNGQGTLTLSGDNADFAGGLYISEGTVNIDSDTGAGTGPIGFGSSSSHTLNFNSTKPTVGGFYEFEGYDEFYYGNPTVNLSSGSILTIDVDYHYLNFGGSIMGDGGLIVTGSGTQELSGYNSFTGGLTITGGANLLASNTSALGGDSTTPPSVLLDGGNLEIDSDSGEGSGSVSASITFGSGGGEIRGNGTLYFEDPLVIANNAAIAPGFSVGRLFFDGQVEFGALGSLNVEIGDDENGGIVADVMLADQLNIAATSSNPFSINLNGDDSVIPEGFDSTQAESWLIVGSLNDFTNFDLSKFELNVASNLESAAGAGIWSLTFDSSGGTFGEVTLANSLRLNFTPVPEPSTFALYALGLLLVGHQVTRRRRMR